MYGPEEAEEEEEVLVEEREARPSSQVGPVDQQEMDLEVGRAASGRCHQRESQSISMTTNGVPTKPASFTNDGTILMSDVLGLAIGMHLAVRRQDSRNLGITI